MEVEVPRVKRFLEERKIEGEKESVLPSFGAICLLYFFSLCPSLPSLAPGCPSAPPASSPPDFLRVLQWNAGGLRARSTELLTLSRPILSTLSAFRNPILTHLPLSGFLDSLLCVLIAPTPGLAFSLLISRTLAEASSFLSGRAYLFLNFLPPPFLRLILTLIM